MPANEHVLDVINKATVKALAAEFPLEREENKQVPAQTAVALLQLSIRYFVETGANKRVIRDFINQLLGPDDPPPAESSIIMPGQRRIR
jgi:hypothetical protein